MLNTLKGKVFVHTALGMEGGNANALQVLSGIRL